MSKRNRTRHEHANPTTEKNRRRVRAWPDARDAPRQEWSRELRLWSLLEDLRDVPTCANLKKAIQFMPGVKNVKVTETAETGEDTGGPKESVHVIVTGREGACPRPWVLRNIEWHLQWFTLDQVELTVTGARNTGSKPL
jgi:hypothetical protein